LPWWVKQSGQLQSLSISLYRFSMAGANFTDLSLQITSYKEDEKRNYQHDLRSFWQTTLKLISILS